MKSKKSREIQYKQLDDTFFLQVEALQQMYINLIYGTLLEDFHRLLKNGDFIGAFDGERLTGYSGAAYSREFKGYAALMTVVAQDYWHQEVGKHLVEAILKRISFKEYLFFEAWTLRPGYPNAYRLLKQLEFQFEKVIPNEEYSKVRECKRCIYRNKQNCKCGITVYSRKGLKTT